jgi:hypothetical protein
MRFHSHVILVRMSNNEIGQWSSFGVFLTGLAYIIALMIGFATRGLSAPIVDPLLAVMEILTLIAAPLMLVMMVSIHVRAPDDCKTLSTIALAFMILTTGTTGIVHFVELTAMRQLGSAGLVWPSSIYAMELLAWDVFLGLSLVFAAFTFEDSGRDRRVRRGLISCGALCLLGVIGPVVGNMRLQLVGVFAYGALLPIVCLLLSRRFRDDARILN